MRAPVVYFTAQATGGFATGARMDLICRERVRTCLWAAVLAAALGARAHAVSKRQDAPAAAPVHAQRPVGLDGRVLAVRRLSREITMRTAQGGVYRIALVPGAAIHAPRGARLDAVRSGIAIHIDAFTGRNGALLARAVSVR